MSRGRAIILAGSPADRAHVESIQRALGEFGVSSQIRIASAHKTPQRLLDLIGTYDVEELPTVYITAAGRSNALSGFVDAATRYPVITCPPPSEQWGAYDIWSSLRMPSGVAPGLILDPANAALFAAKILALGDEELRERVRKFQEKNVARLVDEDEKLIGKGSRDGDSTGEARP